MSGWQTTDHTGRDTGAPPPPPAPARLAPAPADPAWLPAGFHQPVLLGTGGEGEVWRARARKGPSPVAIKRYRKGSGRSFYRELSALLDVDCPQLVGVYGLRDGDDGERMLIMEYCAGGNLRDILASDGPMAPVAALTLGTHMARALSALGANRLIHADVKPENVFRKRRTGAPVWKLGDLGICRREGAKGVGTAHTPAYAAPEQRMGMAATPASDVFSMALVVAECLTGRAVGRGNPAAGTPMPLDTGPTGAGPAVDDFLAACMYVDPAGRPAAAEAERFFADEASRARATRYAGDPAAAHGLSHAAEGIELPWMDGAQNG